MEDGVKKVYVASQYSVGDPLANVRRQIDAGEEIINADLDTTRQLMGSLL